MTVSFKVLTNDNFAQLKNELAGRLAGAAREDIDEIFDELYENLSDGLEYALSAHSGCLLIRIYDGEYLFPYPIALEDGASEAFAVNELRRYVIKEEIPLVICDLPREKIADIMPFFRHVSIDAADMEGDYYTMRPVSELSLVSEIPSEREGEIELTPLTAEDERDYAELCRDKESNRYWGYDFREDTPDADDAYFLETAESEFNRGVAVSLAVRYEGKFVGEAILYAFDLQGGAQCAVRIMKDYRRRGLAKTSLNLLSGVARQMGLLYMHATVDGENYPSDMMCSAFFDSRAIDGRNLIFTKEL